MLNKKRKQHKLNREINYPQVRVVGDNPVVMPTYEAIQLAQSQGLDLILISENGNPPIARIEDYNKFLYHQEKLEKERRKKSTKVEIKEIQLSCTIADNDILTKSRKATEFLEDGNKVKCVINLKGRQKAMPEQGEIVLLKFAQSLTQVGSPENLPRLEGSRWIMMLKPKTK